MDEIFEKELKVWLELIDEELGDEESEISRVRDYFDNLRKTVGGEDGSPGKSLYELLKGIALGAESRALYRLEDTYDVNLLLVKTRK